MPTLPTILVLVIARAPGAGFADRTDAVGLGPDVVPETVARLCFADLDDDGWPDVVVDRHRVLLNRADGASPVGRRFAEVDPATTGLRAPVGGTATVFVDLDGDGALDAVVTELVDALNETWTDHGRRTGWQRGRGDGTFGPRRPLPVPPRTTISVAAGDVNRDGALDLFLGNTYRLYGGGYEGYSNDLVLSREGGWEREALPDEGRPFDPDADDGGRPTFGTMILGSPTGDGPMLLELSYGRRWNRARVRSGDVWTDLAPRLGLDGDEIRHGRYPEWLKERAKTDPRFDRDDEPPFRANGNTFDAAAGDLDGDGDLDLLISEITHGWAGASSDRTRLLLQERVTGSSGVVFRPAPGLSLDRVPADPRRWNQGDLFCALADVDHDGRLDVLVSSGDYPDDQRLRIHLQQPDGTLRDATGTLGVEHDGAQQLSLADVDGDGDLDVLVGQTFNRYPEALRAGRAPRLRLFVNERADGRPSITLRLEGDGVSVNRDALGAEIRATLPDGRVLLRTLVGVGGHAGKQHDFAVHVGLDGAPRLAALGVRWPDRAGTTQRFESVAAGRYRLRVGGALTPEPAGRRPGPAPEGRSAPGAP